MTVPFQQVQVIRQVPPVVRQVTPPRSQQQQPPSNVQTMRSPVVLQKFQSPPGPTAPNPSSSAPAPPVILQQHPQSSVRMFLSNSAVVTGHQLQRIPIAQNLSNSPAAVMVSLLAFSHFIRNRLLVLT